MTLVFAYILKVNIAFALFYAFYRLFFYKDTFFKLRRTILLCFFTLGVVYPFVNMHGWFHANEVINTIVYTYINLTMPDAVVTAEKTQAFNWEMLAQAGLLCLYLLVSAVLLVRFFVRLGSILWLAHQSQRVVMGDTLVYTLPKPTGPFSFFNYIFMHPASHTEADIEEIITHEKTHANQWHSVDVLVCELFIILCWFNPFVWLLKREVRHNLEYLADQRVIQSGYDTRGYQYHLLGLVHCHTRESGLCNSFHVLHLKNRILMMNKKRSRSIGQMKYLALLPLFLLLVCLNNMAAMARVASKIKPDKMFMGADPNTSTPPRLYSLMASANETKSAESVRNEAGLTLASLAGTPQQNGPETISKATTVPLAAESDALSVEDAEVVFAVVEKMPQFPGGDAELFKFLSQQVKYPAEAQEKGIQGRVIVTFVVNSDGSIVSPTVARGVDPLLDAEALRVVATFPKWTPGKQRGKDVRVKYTLPIAFRLQ